MILLCNYMNLYKTEFSALCDEGILDKMLIKCNDKAYYDLEKIIYKSSTFDSVVIKALNKKGLDIVLKPVTFFESLTFGEAMHSIAISLKFYNCNCNV